MAALRYSIPKEGQSLLPNKWDLIALFLIFGVIAGLTHAAGNMLGDYQVGDNIPISLELSILPKYACLTTMRMCIALVASLIFTFTVGTLAAKNKQAEKVLLPLIDIMQSIPPLGLQSIVAVSIIALFSGSLLGPELVAIFLIFTAQVWNMTLSFYQSLKTVPKELIEVSRMYHLSNWQTFWRIEVPFAMPGLLWNTMISMSAGWFFVVEAEAISAYNQSITLSGIGSFINLANQQENYFAFGMAMLTMLLVILIYDQLLLRPLIAWSEKFYPELKDDSSEAEAWFLTLLQRARLINYLYEVYSRFKERVSILIRKKRKEKHKIKRNFHVNEKVMQIGVIFWNSFILVLLAYSVHEIYTIIQSDISISELLHVFFLGGVTMLKIIILIFLASIIWVPVGVVIGLNPKATAIAQPFIQFLAAVPAQLFYPIIFILIINYQLNVEIWTTPLMILGTQWYILFNVIAGVSAIPKELKLAAKNYGVQGSLWWRRFILPSIFPHYVTGAIAAAGGCWNATIVADVVSWGGKSFTATGLGAYIRMASEAEDLTRVVLGITVMCIYVLFLNRFFWKRLYLAAEERYSFTGY